MTSSAFIALLEAHDWHFDKSDDPSAYAKGRESQKRLLYLCQQQPELFRLYNHADNCILRSLPFNFPSVVGTTPVKDETQQYNIQMNVTVTIDITPESANNIVAALLSVVGKPSIGETKADCGQAGSTPAAEKPAPEKPAKAAKAAKPAPAPAPEPEPEAAEEAAEVISEARLKATVKTLPDADKLKLKAYFQKKFSYNTMAEIAEENRADIHAHAIKLGATDTDPDAIGDM